MVCLQRGEKGEDQGNAKRKWFEEKQKRREEELQRLGLPAVEIHRIQTAEHAEQMYKKQDKKVAPTGWEAFNQKALYEAYERRAGNIPYSQEVRDLMESGLKSQSGQCGVGSALRTGTALPSGFVTYAKLMENARLVENRAGPTFTYSPWRGEGLTCAMALLCAPLRQVRRLTTPLHNRRCARGCLRAYSYQC